MGLINIGTVCPVNKEFGEVGTKECLDCMFHNDTYNETKTAIFCVFPNVDELVIERDKDVTNGN